MAFTIQNVASVTGISSLIASGGSDSATQLAGVTYSQSSVYGANNAATYTYMNNGDASGAVDASNNQTGTSNQADAYIMANCGANKWVDHIVIGYDYLNNLTGGWGVAYTQGASIQISDDSSSWTTITTAPTYATTGSTDGLVSIDIKESCQYIRLYRASGYLCLLEFQIWTQ